MTDVLAHRGPDGRGTFCEDYDNGTGVALGHRRLAIIDLDGGGQPICNEDRTVWITFNGEIYNYRELRSDLERRGHRFRTDSDTETIVHLYEERGVNCLGQLRGMFAFAIWDAAQQKLFLARDRLGQKPLVYCEGNGRLLFSSEIKSLLQVPQVRREIEPDALNDFLTYGYVPQPLTMFRGIRKLPAAHYATYRDGRLLLHRYWNPDWDEESSRPVEQLREALREELKEAVRVRLRSDVPIGGFLSGGIDSTTIVGLMQQSLPQPAQTFTVGFQEQAYDESVFAAKAAAHLGTQHRALEIQPASADLLPTLVRHFDEPFGDSSAIPTFGLAQATRAHVKVALTGDGGDELFAGYPRYHTIEKLGRFDRLPGRLRRLIANPAWQWCAGAGGQNSRLARLRFRMKILRETADDRYIHWVATLERASRDLLLTSDFRSRCLRHPEQSLIDALGVSSRAPGKRAMQCDLQTYLPGDLLAKVDITSMAHGLECRSPFLDHHVVERALAIPFHHHVNRRIAKPMLAETFSECIPKELQQRAKMGFCVPLDAWFRGPLREMAHDQLLSSAATTRGYFRPDALQALLAQHQSKRWNHGTRIWSLLCFEQWHRDYIDTDDFSKLASAGMTAASPRRSSTAQRALPGRLHPDIGDVVGKET